MLAPRDTATRERKSLNGLWGFMPDAAGTGRDQGWQHGLPAGAREIPVPASYNDLFPEPAVHDHVGDVWYQTLVRVPARWTGQRIVLRFGSATHRAVVWVNGRQVAEHEGGYTPFEADITGVVEMGAENRITVVVSNVLTWQSIPPGYVEQTPDGPRQRYFHDFFNYAGLHRPVWLYTTPAAHITDVTRRHRPGRRPQGPSTTGSRPRPRDGLQVRVVLTRRRRRRGCPGRGRRRAAHRAGRPSVAAGRGLSLRPRPSSCGAKADALVDSVLAAGRHPDGPRSTAPGSSSTASRSISADSASTRTAPCAARATTTCSWCTTSR